MMWPCRSRYTGEDEAVTEVYNNEAPVSGLGFFGDAPAAHAFCAGHVSRAPPPRTASPPAPSRRGLLAFPAAQRRRAPCLTLLAWRAPDQRRSSGTILSVSGTSSIETCHSGVPPPGPCQAPARSRPVTVVYPPLSVSGTSSIETLSIWSLERREQLQHFKQIRRDQPEEDAPAAVLIPLPYRC